MKSPIAILVEQRDMLQRRVEEYDRAISALKYARTMQSERARPQKTDPQQPLNPLGWPNDPDAPRDDAKSDDSAVEKYNRRVNPNDVRSDKPEPARGPVSWLNDERHTD